MHFLTLFLLSCFSLSVLASGISIGGTRFVYVDNKREITIPILNSNKEKPFLIQSWVTGFENETKAPFIATPPLFRVEPDSHGTARIAYMGMPLSSNEEKLYLLNIKSIPPKRDDIENELQIIINSQFKLFLRSKDIQPLNFDDVNIIRKKNRLWIKNNTPYHLSIKSVFIDSHIIQTSKMVYPWEEKQISNKNIGTEQSVTVEFINDYGAIIEKN
ncbi:fimbria/pilus periplasmic chaperone [Providencia rustigianii]|uniref:fimbrial biogenesis chaperone n=1 Tax=Providencia rustigianii TaxID=158850 RepID=UPI000F71558A|nr:molecular chaperone [Providencia rustigianii]MTC60937.1 fimbria/pilus periplasmic chaperone [Providencia rustigianii]VEH55351.1 Chaperone protein focC precursor [Providencia rustigianii]